MKELKCTNCEEEANTYSELVSGKCRFCNEELEQEKEDESTESEMGYYYNDF